MVAACLCSDLACCLGLPQDSRDSTRYLTALPGVILTFLSTYATGQ